MMWPKLQDVARETMSAAMLMSYFNALASPGPAAWRTVERELLEGPEVTSAHLLTRAAEPDGRGIRSEHAADVGPSTRALGSASPPVGLETRAVPVLPREARPLRRMPGGALLPGALDGLYQELLAARASVVAYGPATPIGREAGRRQHAYVEALLTTEGRAERAEAREHGRFLPSAAGPQEVEAVPSAWWSALASSGWSKSRVSSYSAGCTSSRIFAVTASGASCCVGRSTPSASASATACPMRTCSRSTASAASHPSPAGSVHPTS
jgi:hypothetical protein